MKVYRQGDVLFIPVASSAIPTGEKVKVRKLKTRLIRRGEHGGRHEIEPGGKAEQIEITEGTTRRRFLQVWTGGLAAISAALAGVGIVHGEHKRLDLPARVPEVEGHQGDYEIRVQRELEGNATRFVTD